MIWLIQLKILNLGIWLLLVFTLLQNRPGLFPHSGYTQEKSINLFSMASFSRSVRKRNWPILQGSLAELGIKYPELATTWYYTYTCVIWDDSVIFWAWVFVQALGHIYFSRYVGFGKKERRKQTCVKNLCLPLLFVKARSFHKLSFLEFSHLPCDVVIICIRTWKKPGLSEVS